MNARLSSDQIGVFPHRTRRVVLQTSAGMSVGLLLAACGVAVRDGSAPAGTARNAATEPWSGIAGTGTTRIQTVVAATDLATGPNRFTLGLLYLPEGATEPQRLPDADLRLQFFFPIEPKPIARGSTIPAVYRWVDTKGKGLYVASASFDQSGLWGVEVSGTANGVAIGPARTQFGVKPKSDTPAVGSAAPRSRNLTAKDVTDIRQIDTGVTPNDMHDLTIADAIARGRPVVVVFATPGFCTTQTCAPMIGEIQDLKRRVGADASFIHIEIYKDPANRVPFPTVAEWGLTSEPWVFLIDKKGTVAAKFEGPAPRDELEESLRTLL